MNWYIAKLIFNININNGKNQSQFDEQLRLISAYNSNEAYYKAELIGKSENESFESNADNTIEWQFIDVAEIVLLTEIKDGMELYSNTIKSENPNEFIQHIKLRANQFQNLQVQNN
jgi:hypothetical protein